MRVPWLVVAMLVTACAKHGDNPPPTQAATIVPPPPSLCEGATTTFSKMGIGAMQFAIQPTSSITFEIPHFDLGCGDSVRVYMRGSDRIPPQPWFEYFTNSPVNYYSLAGRMITIHNGASAYQDYDVEAILK